MPPLPGEVILGSSSPRRRHILSSLLPFDTASPPVDETPLPGENPESYTLRMAREKSHSLALNYPSSTLLITGDTTVALNDEILGKPETKEEAERMLLKLSGRNHRVISALHLRLGSIVDCGDIEITHVTFRGYSMDTVLAYMGKVDVMDKAGAYALQEYGHMLVAGIEGSATNVIGFPLRLFFRLMTQTGLADLLIHHF